MALNLLNTSLMHDIVPIRTPGLLDRRILGPVEAAISRLSGVQPHGWATRRQGLQARIMKAQCKEFVIADLKFRSESTRAAGCTERSRFTSKDVLFSAEIYYLEISEYLVHHEHMHVSARAFVYRPSPMKQSRKRSL
jgi:hypothetical protein